VEKRKMVKRQGGILGILGSLLRGTAEKEGRKEGRREWERMLVIGQRA